MEHFQAKQHEMLHTGEKTYACTVCEQKNQTREHFKRHEKKPLLVALMRKSCWSIQWLSNMKGCILKKTFCFKQILKLFQNTNDLEKLLFYQQN